jgi:hypothetical protein
MKTLNILLILFIGISCKEGPNEDQKYQNETSENYSSIKGLVNGNKNSIVSIEFYRVDLKDGTRKLLDADLILNCSYTDVKLDDPYIVAKGTPFHSYYWTGHSYDGATKTMKLYYLPQ